MYEGMCRHSFIDLYSLYLFVYLSPPFKGVVKTEICQKGGLPPPPHNLDFFS